MSRYYEDYVFIIIGLFIIIPNICSTQDPPTVVESGTGPKIQIPKIPKIAPKLEEANDTKPKLTGIPQIDYIHDPNLPRELDGYDLSDYPFYKRVPNVKFNFSCDNRHDGFYASIPHKCQVYHNCLFGVRYDFLCANYTAFDQSNFICHFVSEVDCKNSELYFSRNDELYVDPTTTTTTSTTTGIPPVRIVYVNRPIGSRNRHRRPGVHIQRPAVRDDYYDYEYEVRPTVNNNKDYAYDDYVYDDAVETTPKRRPQNRQPERPVRIRNNPRPPNQRFQGQQQREETPHIPDYGVQGRRQNQRLPPSGQRPNFNQSSRPQRKRRRKTTSTTTTTTTTPAPEYYDDYYEYYYDDGPATTPTPRREGRRPTAEDRRLALLTSRAAHLVPKRITPTNSEVGGPVQELSSSQIKEQESEVMNEDYPAEPALADKNIYEYDDAVIERTLNVSPVKHSQNISESRRLRVRQNRS